ncbi:MAG: hypothetical protein ACK424_08595, partial [Candidatus Thermochlorobacter sp.]
MAGKKYNQALAKIDPKKEYEVLEAVAKIKEISTTKFDASVDIAMRLGVDPRQADQVVRGTVALPHGTGKTVRVLVMCKENKQQEAKEAGAERLRYCDTLGYDSPFSIYERVKELASKVKIPVEIHCHNDLGMVVATSVS